MKSGDTFWADLGYGDHPHVVLSNPFLVEGEHFVIVVMLSTYDADYKNPTCPVYPSDGHPGITRKSSVAYNLAQPYKVQELENKIRQKMPPFSSEIMYRILKGANNNNSDIPMKCWIKLDNQGLIPK